MRDPRNEIICMLDLNLCHLRVNIFASNWTSENTRSCEVFPFGRIAACHHISWVKHLLSELLDRNVLKTFRIETGKRGEPSDKKMETRERNEIDCHLSKIRVELTREPQAASGTRHGHRDQVVEVTVGRSGKFESAQANVIKSFVVNDHDLISVSTSW